MAVVGLELPIRASLALLVATVVVLLDFTGVIRAQLALLTSFTESLPGVAIERFLLFGLVPAVVVVFVFRDGVSRYGLQLGEWRWGLALLGAGLIVMTPIILGASRLPEFAAYYGHGSTSLGGVLVNNVVELSAAEFVLRGFLLFALLRRIGPLALVVVQVPFIFAHIGKPELELWSTFIGGSVFAWLDWRTRSILYSAVGHTYVLTLMLVAAGAVA